MARIRRFIALLTPAPIAGFVSIVAALGVGYLLWIEHEPEPRHIASVNWPQNTGLQSAFLSPDRKSLVFGFISAEPIPLRQRLARWIFLIYDLENYNQFELSTAVEPSIVFSPDGTRIAGIHQESVHIWNRANGLEQKQYALKKPSQSDFVRQIAFIPEGLVAEADCSLDELENTRIHRINLETNLPWQGLDMDFDRVNDSQKLSPLTSAVSADANYSVAFGNAAVFLNDANNKSSKVITHLTRFEITGNGGISPDAKTVIVQGRSWRPVRAAIDFLKFTYSESKFPVATEGLLFVSTDTGMETNFIEGGGEFGITSDSNTFIKVERNNQSSTSTIWIYDWPFAKPWWQIAGGSVTAFAVLVLVNKAWHWLRRKSMAGAEDLPGTTAPRETEATLQDPIPPTA